MARIARAPAPSSHLERTDDKLNFGKSTGKAKRLGRNQKKLRDALEQEYRYGVDCWDDVELRRLAGDIFPRASRSTIGSAIEGMRTHGVLTQSDGRLFLVKPPRRAAQPVRTESAQAQSVSQGGQEAHVRCDNAGSESGVAAWNDDELSRATAGLVAIQGATEELRR